MAAGDSCCTLQTGTDRELPSPRAPRGMESPVTSVRRVLFPPLSVPLLLVAALAIATGCSAKSAATSAGDSSDAGLPGISTTPPDAGAEPVGIDPPHEDRPADAGYGYDGGVLRADRFVTHVVSFTPGPCAGFGQSAMPDVVFGPPHGAGDAQGGYDVVSLGVGGEIVLGFDDAIVDGVGDDFVVFENAFFAGGNSTRVAADLGEVAVSDDGATWTAFPCTATTYPFGACAGWHPVYSSPENGISPVAPEAGGDRYDLAAIGVARARFVRIRDMRSNDDCPAGAPVKNYGFDLDAIVSVNAERP